MPVGSVLEPASLPLKKYYKELQNATTTLLTAVAQKLLELPGVMQWVLQAGATVAALEDQSATTLVASGAVASPGDMRNTVAAGVRLLPSGVLPSGVSPAPSDIYCCVSLSCAARLGVQAAVHIGSGNRTRRKPFEPALAEMSSKAADGLAKNLGEAIVERTGIPDGVDRDAFVRAAGTQILLGAINCSPCVFHNGGKGPAQVLHNSHIVTLVPPTIVPDAHENMLIVKPMPTSDNCCTLGCMLTALAESMDFHKDHASRLQTFSADAALRRVGVDFDANDSLLLSARSRLQAGTEKLGTAMHSSSTNVLRGVLIAVVEAILHSASRKTPLPQAGVSAAGTDRPELLPPTQHDVDMFLSERSALFLHVAARNDVGYLPCTQDTDTSGVDPSEIEAASLPNCPWMELYVNLITGSKLDGTTVFSLCLRLYFWDNDAIAMYVTDRVYAKADNVPTVNVRELTSNECGTVPCTLLQRIHAFGGNASEPFLETGTSNEFKVLFGKHGNMLGARSLVVLAEDDVLESFNHYDYLLPQQSTQWSSELSGVWKHSSASAVLRIDWIAYSTNRVLMARHGTEGLSDSGIDSCVADLYYTTATAAIRRDDKAKQQGVRGDARCNALRNTLENVTGGPIPFVEDCVSTLADVVADLGETDDSLPGGTLTACLLASEDGHVHRDSVLSAFAKKPFRRALGVYARRPVRKRAESAASSIESIAVYDSEHAETAQSRLQMSSSLDEMQFEPLSDAQRAIQNVIQATLLQDGCLEAVDQLCNEDRSQPPTDTAKDAARVISEGFMTVVCRTLEQFLITASPSAVVPGYYARRHSEGVLKESAKMARRAASTSTSSSRPRAPRAVTHTNDEFDVSEPPWARARTAPVRYAQESNEYSRQAGSRRSAPKRRRDVTSGKRHTDVVTHAVHGVVCEVFDEDYMAWKVLVDWGPHFGTELSLDEAMKVADESDAADGRYTYELKLNTDEAQWARIESHSNFKAIQQRVAATAAALNRNEVPPPRKRRRRGETDSEAMSVQALLDLLKADEKNADLASQIEAIIQSTARSGK